MTYPRANLDYVKNLADEVSERSVFGSLSSALANQTRNVVEELRSARAGVEKAAHLRDLLKRLEWAGIDPAWWPETPPCCPACKGLKEGTDAGHDPDCWLATELDRERAAGQATKAGGAP